MSTQTPAAVGIDVGGTFTDAVALDESGLRVRKVRSTPQDPSNGFLDALAALRGARTLAPAYLAHGTTVATNAIVQRRLARTALITNEGFQDLLEIGTQMRPRIYDLWTPLPAPVVPRERCFGVRGRIASDGSEVEPLDLAQLEDVARALSADGVQAVAVACLFSFVEATHERRIREALRAAAPGIEVALSSEVAPEFREYVRASTTVLNAALLPLVGGYVAALADRLVGEGDTEAELHLMQSNGGLAVARAAAELPVALAASGPAAGVTGAAQMAAAAGERDLLTIDMGGTTADVALVLDGRPQLRFSGEHAGHPVNLPQVDVLSIGAGGGSIASVDAFRALTVGPQSAGAEPGPASYGRGGTRATVTDAHVVLGTLGGDRALGGDLRLDEQAAREAIARDVGEPLGLDEQAAAVAVLRVADANMADALRLVSVARGHDPRGLCLVAIGGAGPLHACAIASELDVRRVVVPRYPGVVAALGLLLSDVRHDLRRSWIARTEELMADPAKLDAALGELEADGRALLADSGRADDGQIAFEIDMRYQGQAYALTVPVAARPVTPATMREAERAFHAAHRDAYDYTPQVESTEVVTVRARATAPAPVGAVPPSPAVVLASAGRRDVGTADGPRRYRVLRREQLAAGDTVAPESIIEQDDTTTVVPGGWCGTVAADGSMVLEPLR